jgi:hypothetical protein
MYVLLRWKVSANKQIKPARLSLVRQSCDLLDDLRKQANSCTIQLASPSRNQWIERWCWLYNYQLYRVYTQGSFSLSLDKLGMTGSMVLYLYCRFFFPQEKRTYKGENPCATYVLLQ